MVTKVSSLPFNKMKFLLVEGYFPLSVGKKINNRTGDFSWIVKKDI
jgi:hypothetical protein